MDAVIRTLRTVNVALAFAAGLLLLCLLALICINVFGRYALNAPLNWVDQVTGYFLIYFTFLGAPWVLANRGHVAIEALQAVLNQRGRRILNANLDLAGCLYCLAFTYLGVLECTKLVRRGSDFADVIEVPQVLVYGVIPLGSFLLALQFAANFYSDRRNRRGSPDQPSEPERGEW